MSLTRKTIETRPSTNIPFYEFQPSEVEYMVTNYGNKIDSIFMDWKYSDDGLVRRTDLIFKDKVYADEFDNDQVIRQLAIRKLEYCDSNNIIRTSEDFLITPL